MVKKTIIEKLKAIAQDHNICMLYACESGSRGWEFPSPDSDYDVRFIYIRARSEYLSIQDQEDNLSFPIDNELDIYGWDLRKVLKLMMKSNTTPFEWLQSPIVYYGVPGFRDDLWALAQHYFSRRSNTHHYLGIAKGALETAQGDEIKIKKLFYVLRPLLSAKWCMEKQTIAPMTIGPLIALLPEDLRRQVSDLIALKATAPEGFIVRVGAALRQYIEQEFTACSEASGDLPKDSFAVAELDNFFRKTIMNHDDTGAER
jgi:predicted nucleotidyltransferase